MDTIEKMRDFLERNTMTDDVRQFIEAMIRELESDSTAPDAAACYQDAFEPFYASVTQEPFTQRSAA